MDEKFKKIVVKAQDELIDIIRYITNTDSQRILLTFAEDSEVLISAINLKVLLDSTDEKEAVLVLQIINNPTGIRNAQLAGITVIDTPTSPTEDIWQAAQNDFTSRLNISQKKGNKLPEEYKSANIATFEERINSVLSKSGVKSKERDVSSDIAIDQDIFSPQADGRTSEQEDLTKVDFKDIPDPVKTKSKKKFSFPTFFKKKPVSASNLGESKRVAPKDLKSKILRILPKVAIPLVIVLFLVAFLYYKFAPYVTVTLHIQSKPVEVEKMFTGNENINQIDFEKLEIPIKTEEVTKSVSDSVTATGVAYRGEKATGSITVSYINTSGCTDANAPVVLSVGHQVTTEGKKFVLTGDLTVTCNNYGAVGVEAVEVGEEYNIASGKYFSINGYDSKVFATNSSAFTGGSKTQYTVLSQKDVNTKAEELTAIATEDGVSSLSDIGNGWEIIESTVVSKLKDGSIKSSVTIGTETKSSDVSLEVTTTATYYYTNGVDEGLNTLLTEAAVNQNLFEDAGGLNLTLTGDIQKDLTVQEGDGVNIKLVASSSVEPTVNKEGLISDLEGLSWEEGGAYIRALKFTSGSSTVTFTPEGFPLKLRHFPSRQGRINIKIVKDTVESE